MKTTGKVKKNQRVFWLTHNKLTPRTATLTLTWVDTMEIIKHNFIIKCTESQLNERLIANANEIIKILIEENEHTRLYPEHNGEYYNLIKAIVG